MSGTKTCAGDPPKGLAAWNDIVGDAFRGYVVDGSERFDADLEGGTRQGNSRHLYSRGTLATNEQLVARTVRIATDLGLEIASPDEARATLGLRAPVPLPS